LGKKQFSAFEALKKEEGERFSSEFSKKGSNFK